METDYKWRLEHLGTPRIMGETCSPTKGDSTKCHYLSHAVYSGVIPGLTWRLLLAQVATVQLAKDANAEITGGGKVVLTRLWKEKKSEIWNKCVSKQEKRRQRLTHFFFPFSASCVCTKALWNFGVCVLRASERSFDKNWLNDNRGWVVYSRKCDGQDDISAFKNGAINVCEATFLRLKRIMWYVCLGTLYILKTCTWELKKKKTPIKITLVLILTNYTKSCENECLEVARPLIFSLGTMSSR